MTETSGFMDPGTYDAAQFARSLFGIIKDGYQNNYLNELAVTAHTPNAMSVDVATGAAWVQGCWYTSSAVNTLTIDAAHATLDRIDRIILRKTATTSIQAVVLKGTAAASPAAPTLTQTTDGTYEISLAQVLVTHAVTSIAGTGTTLITDERNAAYAAMGDLTITAAGNLAMGTHRITGLTDPSGDQDADTKAARNSAISTAISGAIHGCLLAVTTYTSGSGNHATNASTTKVSLMMIGGGGGGGAGNTQSGSYVGGVGGVGCRAQVFYKTVTGSTNYAYVVGALGAGASAGQNGSDGTSTTFTIGATTYTAGYGGGGVKATSGAAGAPGSSGTATNCDLSGTSDWIYDYGLGGAGGAYAGGSNGTAGKLIIFEYS